jgi:hypothetical protein
VDDSSGSLEAITKDELKNPVDGGRNWTERVQVAPVARDLVMITEI